MLAKRPPWAGIPIGTLLIWDDDDSDVLDPTKTANGHILRRGHPGVVVSPNPMHLVVCWLGLEDDPLSWAIGFCARPDGTYGALRLVGEEEWESAARSGWWADVDHGPLREALRGPLEGDWPLMGALVLWAGEDSAANIGLTKRVRGRILRRGHPGAIVSDHPEGVGVYWLGLDDEPVSRDVEIRPAPDGTYPQLHVATEDEWQAATQAGWWRDAMP